MRANISIDVSLLAIVLAMYFTKQDDRMILVLVAILVTHILMTSDEDYMGNYGGELGMGAEDEEESPSEEQPNEEPLLVSQKDSTPLEQEKETVPKEPFPKPFTPREHFKTTVSSGVFDRNISTPQTRTTSSIFPKTSEEANGKLANARGSFFESLVS